MSCVRGVRVSVGLSCNHWPAAFTLNAAGQWFYGLPKRLRYSCELTNPLTIVRKSDGFAFR
jgi:hypothetical protein